MTLDETWDLYEMSGVERVRLGTEAVLGDIKRAEKAGAAKMTDPSAIYY